MQDFLVTACTSWSCLPSSSSTFLAKVEILAFISISSDSAYIPPHWLTDGLILSISLGLGSSQPLEVSATDELKSHLFLVHFSVCFSSKNK